MLQKCCDACGGSMEDPGTCIQACCTHSVGKHSMVQRRAEEVRGCNGAKGSSGLRRGRKQKHWLPLYPTCLPRCDFPTQGATTWTCTIDFGDTNPSSVTEKNVSLYGRKCQQLTSFTGCSGCCLGATANTTRLWLRLG